MTTTNLKLFSTTALSQVKPKQKSFYSMFSQLFTQHISFQLIQNFSIAHIHLVERKRNATQIKHENIQYFNTVNF